MDELRTVIGLLLYVGVFESSHEHKESLYKMDVTGRLVLPAVDMLDQMCARYTVQQATRRWTMTMFYGMINILCSKCIGHICEQHAQSSA